MPIRDESTPSEEPTLKDIGERLNTIEKCLKLQRKEAAQAVWRTVAIFGASIIMVAVGLWIERNVCSPVGFMANYAFLVVCGFGIMLWALCHYFKVKRKP